MTGQENNSGRKKFDSVRKEWDENDGKWHFSVVDIVSITTKSSDPRNYWKVLKSRLKNTRNELVTECNQLKLEATDGKFYLTDVADVYVVSEILKIISPSNLLPFKAWALAQTKPKIDQNSTSSATRKMAYEIAPKGKNRSYPQVTYTLANLIKKNSPHLVEKGEEKTEKTNEKHFKKVTKMRTI